MKDVALFGFSSSSSKLFQCSICRFNSDTSEITKFWAIGVMKKIHFDFAVKRFFYLCNESFHANFKLGEGSVIIQSPNKCSIRLPVTC